MLINWYVLKELNYVLRQFDLKRYHTMVLNMSQDGMDTFVMKWVQSYTEHERMLSVLERTEKKLCLQGEL